MHRKTASSPEEILRQSAGQYRRLIDNLHAGVVVHAPDTRIELCNSTAAALLGLPEGEMSGKTAQDPTWDFIWPDGTSVPVEQYPVNQVLTTGHPVVNLMGGICRRESQDVVWVLVNAFPDFDEQGELERVVVTFIDITDRRRVEQQLREAGEMLERCVAERTAELEGTTRRLQQQIDQRQRMEEEREITIDVLHLANADTTKVEFVRQLCSYLRDRIGVEAVGVRLREGGDFPYFETRGFPEEFVAAENSLCSRHPDGEPARDHDGNPILECMCGNVICGRVDPNLPFFTEQGSFWTNSTTDLLATTDEADRQTRTRNRCHAEGYESVALIPLRLCDDPIGLIQLNDRRRDRFHRGTIDLLETVAQSVTSALARRSAEQLQESSEREWQDTSDASEDAICLLDINRRILRCNRAMTELLGKPVEEILGRPCYEAVHGLACPAEGCMFTQLVRTGCHQARTIERDGRCLLLNLNPLYDDPGNLIGAVHTMADVTERKQLEQAARDAEQELERQRVLRIYGDRLRSLGEMAAGIAHELNQPLLGVRGLAEHLLLAMQRGWDLPEDKIQQKLSLVVQQADRMAHLIEHVRVFAREAGKLDRCPVKWKQVVESALQMIGAQLHSRGFTVRAELADDLPLVSANPFSLEEIVLNLVFNARDAVQQRVDAGHPLRPPDIRLRTCAEGEPPDRRVLFQVIDTGDGIPEDRIDKVFDPFFTTKPPNEGTGLGLSICKSITAQFDGTMELESTVGEGTTVTVSLPAAEVADGA